MSELPIYPLSEEHKMLRDAARDFAQNEIVPIAAQFDESGEFPYETIKKMGGMGFMGIEVDEANILVSAAVRSVCDLLGYDPLTLANEGKMVLVVAPEAADAVVAAVQATRYEAPNPRILLIEDSVHYQNLISLLVRQQFPQVQLHIADDGIAGLALAGQLRPQVLVVDILLPGIDGGTLITSLRSHPQFANTRLIVVTSLDEEQRAPYAFALSGVPVVHKPRLVAELPALLRSHLAAVAAPQAAPPP